MTPAPVLTVYGLLLAAGSSERMGSVNKLLAEVGGMPVVRGSAMAVLEAVEKLFVVTGYQADRVRGALDGLNVRFVHNPNFLMGMGTSVAVGAGAVPSDAAGVLIALGDMPFLAPATIAALVGAFHEDPSRVYVPTFHGERGNPVLWPARCIPALTASAGDVGGRVLLGSERVHRVPVPDAFVVKDLDTPGDLAQLT